MKLNSGNQHFVQGTSGDKKNAMSSRVAVRAWHVQLHLSCDYLFPPSLTPPLLPLLFLPSPSCHPFHSSTPSAHHHHQSYRVEAAFAVRLLCVTVEAGHVDVWTRWSRRDAAQTTPAPRVPPSREDDSAHGFAPQLWAAGERRSTRRTTLRRDRNFFFQVIDEIGLQGHDDRGPSHIVLQLRE